MVVRGLIRTSTRAGICICTILLISLIVGCASWSRSTTSQQRREQYIATSLKTDSGVANYQMLVIRTYMPRETISLLQTETIHVSGVTHYVDRVKYLTKTERDTIYIQKEGRGVLVSEPPRMQVTTAWVIVGIVVLAVLFFFGVRYVVRRAL